METRLTLSWNHRKYHRKRKKEKKMTFTFDQIFSCTGYTSIYVRRVFHARALARIVTHALEAFDGLHLGRGQYPPFFPQERDPYLKARTHEMIQLFDLCHALPFYVSWPMPPRACPFTLIQHLRLNDFHAIDLLLFLVRRLQQQRQKKKK